MKQSYLAVLLSIFLNFDFDLVRGADACSWLTTSLMKSNFKLANMWHWRVWKKQPMKDKKSLVWQSTRLSLLLKDNLGTMSKQWLWQCMQYYKKGEDNTVQPMTAPALTSQRSYLRRIKEKRYLSPLLHKNNIYKRAAHNIYELIMNSIVLGVIAWISKWRKLLIHNTEMTQSGHPVLFRFHK